LTVGGDGGLILQVVTVLIAAGAVYGGIRSDIRAMHENLQRVEKMAAKAHDRIDAIAAKDSHHAP
jgi:hypothetical protein